MTYYSPLPSQTPPLLTALLLITGIVSVTVALIDSLLATISPTLSVASWLALSEWGWSHYHLWQPLTYTFLYPAYGLLTISYLIELSLLLYLLWIMGVEVCERIGAKSFVIVYLIVSAIAGVWAIAVVPGYGVVEGPVAAILMTMTLWTMLGPYGELLLFFLIPLARYWLFVIVVGALLLVNIAAAHWLLVSWYLIAILSGYLYGTVWCHFSGPLPWCQRLDTLLYHVGDNLKGLLERFKKSTSPPVVGPKIFDFRTGEPLLDDDAFIDAMLAKIARDGEKSLSWSERKRMDEIAAKRRR